MPKELKAQGKAQPCSRLLHPAQIRNNHILRSAAHFCHCWCTDRSGPNQQVLVLRKKLKNFKNRPGNSPGVTPKKAKVMLVLWFGLSRRPRQRSQRFLPISCPTTSLNIPLQTFYQQLVPQGKQIYRNIYLYSLSAL